MSDVNKKVDSEIQVMTSSPDDPRLNKNLGYITALPSEFLVHFRKGKLSRKTSGQGKTCFKWRRDTVFIIPTSLKEISFKANQLTSDNVDVQIRGMAVYRINDPLRIYEKINFKNRQAAEEKLAKMIGDMCRSTSKWLVSNMQVDECMRKRKEEIAEALNNEISTVVSHPEKGWGAEIITIDINDVYIQDDEVFNAIQMSFKNEKIRESELSKLEMQKELENKKLETERYLLDKKKGNEIEKARVESEIKEEQIRLSRTNDEKQFELDRFRVEQNENLANYKQNQEQTREREQLVLDKESREQNIMLQQKAAEQILSALKMRIETENNANQMSNERLFYEKTLPGVAKDIALSMSDANLTMYNQNSGEGGALPFNMIFSEIMDLLKKRGMPEL